MPPPFLPTRALCPVCGVLVYTYQTAAKPGERDTVRPQFFVAHSCANDHAPVPRSQLDA
jgi:predicted  nucleic acid-binding Zn-ribbon protein